MQDILTGLTPLMSKHGMVIMQTEVERGFMDNGNAIFATYDFTIMHKSGEVWPFPQRQTGVSNTRTSKGTFDDKGLNKCHTSARKYFLLSLFQIPDHRRRRCRPWRQRRLQRKARHHAGQRRRRRKKSPSPPARNSPPVRHQGGRLGPRAGRAIQALRASHRS